MIVYPLTENQVELLQGQWFCPGILFNPIQVNDLWIISPEEVENCVNPDCAWVKDLTPIEV